MTSNFLTKTCFNSIIQPSKNVLLTFQRCKKVRKRFSKYFKRLTEKVGHLWTTALTTCSTELRGGTLSRLWFFYNAFTTRRIVRHALHSFSPRVSTQSAVKKKTYERNN